LILHGTFFFSAAVKLTNLHPTGYFDAKALFVYGTHTVTVEAEGRTECPQMARNAFKRLRQPIFNIIKEKAQHYYTFTKLDVLTLSLILSFFICLF
jgi:hypothetical protein